MRMYAVHTVGSETVTRPRLKLSVRNFGPIESADISLKPLTILLGPNNCGKSYIAKLVHSVISCETRMGTSRFLPYRPPRPVWQKILDMAKCIDDGRTACSDVAGDLMRAYMSNFFPKVLLKNLSVTAWDDVIRFGSRSISIDIRSGVTNAKIHGTAESLNVDVTAPDVCVDQNLKMPHSPDDAFQFDEARNELKHSIMQSHVSYAQHPERMMDVLAALFEFYITKNSFHSSFYVPDERAGVLDVHRSAIDGMLNTTSTNDDATGSTESEFIAWLLFLKDKRGVFANLADKMELAMTGGRIDVTRHTMGHISEIFYVRDGHKTPVHATSSSIRAMTPLFLQLKYGITARDVLILEEPEAGLDLDNQTRLAAFIVRLVRLGLCLVVTTHSTYFINKMSNCLRSGILHDAGYGYSVISKDESISRDEIAVYQFERSGDADGYRTTLAKLTAYSGIDESVFTHTDDELYKELLALDRQANNDMVDE